MLMNYYIGRLTTRKECTNIKNDVSLSSGLYQHNRRFILSCTAFYYCHGITQVIEQKDDTGRFMALCAVILA